MKDLTRRQLFAVADAAVPRLRIWWVVENHSECWAYRPRSITVADRVDTARRSRRLGVRACAGRCSDSGRITRVILGRSRSVRAPVDCVAGGVLVGGQRHTLHPVPEPHGGRRETRSPAARTSQSQRSDAAVGPMVSKT